MTQPTVLIVIKKIFFFFFAALFPHGFVFVFSRATFLKKKKTGRELNKPGEVLK